MGVVVAMQGRLGCPIPLKAIEILEEEEPRALLGVVELTGTTRIFPEDVVDIFEGLFEYEMVDQENGKIERSTGGIAADPFFMGRSDFCRL